MGVETGDGGSFIKDIATLTMKVKHKKKKHCNIDNQDETLEHRYCNIDDINETFPYMSNFLLLIGRRFHSITGCFHSILT